MVNSVVYPKRFEFPCKDKFQENLDFLQLLLNTSEDSENVTKDGELMHDALSHAKKVVFPSFAIQHMRTKKQLI